MTHGLGRLGLRVALVVAPRLLVAQDTTQSAVDSSKALSRAGHFHLGLTIHGYGISLGNAARVTGIRLNVQDADLDRVDGINVTLWKPREPLTGTVNGVQVGFLPGARDVNGVALGLGGVVTERRARWITLGGLGAVSNGTIEGIGIGGLGLVADGSIYGLGVGGLGAVANGDFHGVGISGLGTVADRDIRGIAASGLGTVANRDIAGLAVAGLGTVANRDVSGVGVAGLGLVANGSITGVGISGLAVVANGRLTGLGIGGLAVVANEAIRGMAVAGYSVDTHRMGGLAVSPYNHIRGPQYGLVIGFYNSTLELHGIQVGVLNRAKNNRPPFRVLPLFNVHL